MSTSIFNQNRVRRNTAGRLTIEKASYAIFCEKFDKGEFGTQRLGQAFYDYYKLHRLSDQSQVEKIYVRDHKEAKDLIDGLFDMT